MLGLRRQAGYAVAILIVLSLAGGMWTFGVCRYLRHHGPYPALSPTLHQVELAHRETPTITRIQGSTHTTASWATHARVSFPEYRKLAGTGIPARETATYRARLIVSGPDGSEPGWVLGRFVNADFFSMFQLGLASGRPFTRAEEALDEAVVVLGQRLHRRLFGSQQLGPSTTITVEGRAFRVLGVRAGDQPVRPVWDIASMDSDQDALYLPFAWGTRMLARPLTVVPQSAVGERFDELLASDTLFVSVWLDLATPAQVAAYQQHLGQRFGAGAAQAARPHLLRSYDEWRRAFSPPHTRVAFLSLLSALLLLVAGFSVARLLLAKGISRRGELGVHRALGASRSMLFARQMLEAAALSLPAALVGILVALPYIALFNHAVRDIDIPVQLTMQTFLLGTGICFLAGLVAALYPSWRASRTPPSLYAERN